MKIAISSLSAVLLVIFLSSAVFASCPEFSNWSTSWTDSYGQTKYKLKAPCKVYLGIPFTITASATDSYYPNSTVGWNWKIIDNGVVVVEDYSPIFGIRLTNGYWQTSLERSYTGSPIDHTLGFSFTDYGKGSGGMGWGGSTVGGFTVDPYLITLASDFSFSADQQSGTLLPATVFVPAGSNPLTYRWLEGAEIIQSSQQVNGTGTVSVPLNLSALSPLSVGVHSLTLEVTDGTLAGSKTTLVTVTSSPIAGSCSTSNGQFFTSIPTTNLCSAGTTASIVTGTGPWYWSCTGLYGGSTAFCSAQAGVAATSGSNVSVTPLSGVSVTFNSVVVAGTVTATPTADLTPPPNFQIINGSSYLISTTTIFSGTIDIKLNYNESALANKNNERGIKLFHYNSSSQKWEDVTSSVDTVNNIVYGRVSSLSPFILAESTSGIPRTPVGGFGMSLVTMFSILGYGYWKSRK